MSRRDDLVEATRDLLWERGYGATSPRAILDASGVGQGSMYHHFHGKEDLAREAIERNAIELRAQVSSDLASEGTALEKVRAYLSRRRDVLKGCRFGRLVQDPDVVGSAALRGPVDETFRWIQEQLAAVIREGVDRDEFHPGLDPVRTAATITATLQGAYVLARAEHDVAAFDDAIDGLLDLLAAARA